MKKYFKKYTRHHSHFLFYLICSFIIFTLFITIFFNTLRQSLISSYSPKEKGIATTSTSTYFYSKEIKLEAKAYVIYDIENNKVISGKNYESPLPLASLTKIFTVGTFLEKYKNQNIQIDENIKNKIKRSLVQSSNEDVESLSEIYKNKFKTNLLDDTQTFIKSLGVNDLKLENLTGLDNIGINSDKDTPSNFASTESIAKTFAYMYKNNREFFEYTIFDLVNEEKENGSIDKGKYIINTNPDSNNTFGLLASKTGYTEPVGGNLSIIVSPAPGRTYVLVVMQSSKEGRFEDMRKLVKLLPEII